MTFAVDIDANVIQFQCPSCGFELRQTIGLLKAEKRMVCAGCNVGINIDTVRLPAATAGATGGGTARAERNHYQVLPVSMISNNEPWSADKITRSLKGLTVPASRSKT